MNNLAEKISRFTAEHPDKQVAIHCTHGFNRTGFLVCAYLKLHRGYTVPMAVATFAKIRQGGIYRTEIIQALYDFYHHEKITVAEVPTPIWHTKEKKSTHKKESLKKSMTFSNEKHSRSPPESSREAAFLSASRNPLGNSYFFSMKKSFNFQMKSIAKTQILQFGLFQADGRTSQRSKNWT